MWLEKEDEVQQVRTLLYCLREVDDILTSTNITEENRKNIPKYWQIQQPF